MGGLCYLLPARLMSCSDSYQYALLNLAVLHANFDNIQEAMQVLREALQVAQENGDDDCIAYCLRYSLRLMSAHSFD